MSRVRGGRARFILGVAALVTVAAACQPVAPDPPPQPVAQACVGSPPVTPTDYQAAFDHLRLTYTEWASADGSIPIDLPDGRTVWLFSDTYVGKVNPGGAIPPSSRIVRNSFVVQTGSCLAPLMGGSPLARSELIPNPASNEWYWPASGVVDGSVLRVFLWHMQSTGSSGPLNFNTLDMRMATFSLPSLTLQGVTPLTFTDATHPYGATAMVAPVAGGGQDLYLYGTYHDSDYVARVPLGQETDPSAWTFWSGARWLPTPTAAQSVQWSGVPPSIGQTGPGTGPAAQPWIVPYGSEFLATSKAADAFSPDVSIYTAPTAVGPWTVVEQVADTSASDVQAYGAFLRGATSPNPIVVYSVNTTFDSSPPPPSISNYGSRFVPPSATLPPPPP